MRPAVVAVVALAADDFAVAVGRVIALAGDEVSPEQLIRVLMILSEHILGFVFLMFGFFITKSALHSYHEYRGLSPDATTHLPPSRRVVAVLAFTVSILFAILHLGFLTRIGYLSMRLSR